MGTLPTPPSASLWRRIAAKTPWGVVIMGAGVGALWLIGHLDGNTAHARGVGLAAGGAAPPLSYDVLGAPGASGQPMELPEDARLSAADTVSFAIHNNTGDATWFMVYAIDDKQTLSFVYPQSDSADGQSFPLAASPEASLPQPVSLAALRGGSVRLVALFTPEPVRVADVREAFRRGGLEAVQRDSHATQLQVHTLNVE